MRYQNDVHIQDGLMTNFDMLLEENGTSKEDIVLLKNVLWTQNNFTASTSWKQQYQFVIALAHAYSIGKYGNSKITHY